MSLQVHKQNRFEVQVHVHVVALLLFTLLPSSHRSTLEQLKLLLLHYHGSSRCILSILCILCILMTSNNPSITTGGGCCVESFTLLPSTRTTSASSTDSAHTTNFNTISTIDARFQSSFRGTEYRGQSTTRIATSHDDEHHDNGYCPRTGGTDTGYHGNCTTSSDTYNTSIEDIIYPFQRFTFAPNSVCTHPKTFFCNLDTHESTTTTNNNDAKTNTTISDSSEEDGQLLEFSMKNVPGTGDCMFLAVALATSTSMGLGGNNAFLNAVANETRDVVAQILSTPQGHLHVQGKRIVRVRDLLLSAAKNERVKIEDYIELLRNGTLQGGGPELTVLSNVLRRPISIYELDQDFEVKYSEDVGFTASASERSTRIGTPIPLNCRIKCVGSFGDIFKDPCSDLPRPAVLSSLLPEGAYSWHIHILVVDAGPGEKHACALLPKFSYVI